MVTLHAEPQWERRQWGPPADDVLTRPLLGSELLVDQLSVLYDGLAECCMGFSFTTTLSPAELFRRVSDAIGRLRFLCPVIAASIEEGIHDAQLRSWVYWPVKDEDDLREWLKQSVVMLEEPVDPDSFIQKMNQVRLPYVLSNGRRQPFRCYIFRPGDAPNSFAIHFHGSHAFMDARPTWHAFSLLFQWIANQDLVDIMSLPWGTEIEHLPVGPIAATGGIRPDWDVGGQSLLGKISQLLMNTTPSHGIARQQDAVTIRGKPIRARTTLSASQTTRLLTNLKSVGLSLTQLLDAATALAVFALNPPEEDATDAHITYPVTMISLERAFAPSVNAKSHFISSMVLLPFNLNWIDVSDIEDERSRVHVAMRKFKQQYDDYLASPHLPQVTSAQMNLAPPRQAHPIERQDSISPTNIGMVDQFVPAQWFDGSDDLGKSEPLLSLYEMSFGHRSYTGQLMVHGWTMQSRFMIQIQASDVWDKAQVEKLLGEIVERVMLLAQPE
ncbi:hypothetical protein CERSUDRAFT_116144 [Gelatoporia subvermispora B]|uniref:Condensation domain-containing protein n=1 Tax=Ceriporiopsis subvermispora (strain B) TaxID=914234 RepID=M2QTG9_CERS8|nr:hypothetical protein CERSUDRAFT_116144 [Gelatoporia subvermispora B]